MDAIINEVGKVLEEGNGGWNVEINKVSWYGKESGWDIRAWNEDHTKCGKGIRLSDQALMNLRDYLNEVFPKEDN